MKIIKVLIITVIALFIFNSNKGFSQDKKDEKIIRNPLDSVKIDKIEISKNWITWDRIIRNELLFKEGEWVRYGEIDTSINKVRNIGNFADVKYTIHDSAGISVIEIQALDGVQFYPLITIDHKSENDYNYRLGFGNKNLIFVNRYRLFFTHIKQI